MTAVTTPKKQRFSLVRTFVLADLITLGNAFCGTGAVLASMSYVATGDRAAIWGALEANRAEALANGMSLLMGLWDHPDNREGPRAFAEKRDPRFKGR